MKKLAYTLLILIVLTFSLANTAFASHGQTPAGSCPPAFELHDVMDHDGEHMHTHIGAEVDFNGDGYLCMKHVTPDLHLHVDNSLP